PARLERRQTRAVAGQHRADRRRGARTTLHRGTRRVADRGRAKLPNRSGRSSFRRYIARGPLSAILATNFGRLPRSMKNQDAREALRLSPEARTCERSPPTQSPRTDDADRTECARCDARDGVACAPALRARGWHRAGAGAARSEAGG